MSGPYNIQVLRGLSGNYSLLSCTADGHVDLFYTDDGSGRQEWNLTPISGVIGNVFNIIVSGGTNPDKIYLSCTAAGLVDLYSQDDGSGRQRWVLTPVTSSPQIPSYYQITPIAGASGYLSCTPDGLTVDLYNQDDGSGRQRWQVQGPALPK
ncbi:MAG TPA: hypothetical protein VGO50_07040 [Pyrinomonadaceae bacterium]|jgi:hypothetical protein|nr:hypothetical protein [Pyrinomonadaceae bacterium]